MKKEYLVFHIENCAEEYIGVYRFLDQISGEKDRISVPERLVGKVHWYWCGEGDTKQYRMEKVISDIAREMRDGLLEPVDHIEAGSDRRFSYFLRVRHGENDATIEYIYLYALLHRFSTLACFLYTEAEEENQKYAVFNKAEDFFYGFSGKKKGRQDRIFGEFYSRIDKMWQIMKVGERRERQETESQKHSKVYPLIKISEDEQEIQFWRNSVGVYRENAQESDDWLERVVGRCERDFTEDFRGKAKKRTQYYRELFRSEAFWREVEDMPLLAFYLFCMQIYYQKDGKCLTDEQIKRIRLYARDVADGILQLMENVHHATGRTGFMSIRVHENTPDKSYLRKRYGIDDREHAFYYEIRLLDLSEENIVESFQRRMQDIPGVDRLQVKHFFKRTDDEAIRDFWEIYNQKEENLVHHYGLQVFSSIVSANGGVFKVISSSKYEYDEDSEKYTNENGWNQGDSGRVHLPGTEYIVLLPLCGREQRLVTSVEVDAEYQYDMDAEYEVKEYEEETEEPIPVDVYASQEQKEAVINRLAEKMYDGLNGLEASIDPGKVFIAFFSIEKWSGGFLEIYCKALILCGIWRQARKRGKFYCVISGCTENQIVEIARLFAIFYCKTGMREYLSDMQIYLAGEDEELLITGRSLNSLYALTSKIMLVKGISKETTNIMRYLLSQYGTNAEQEESDAHIKLVPFDILTFPGRDTTLFEKNVKQTLEADIQKYSLGCKISDTHMRIGSKLHITEFFEAELLFHNDYYISRFAELIMKRLPVDRERKTILVGYETYSELLLYKIVAKLRSRSRGDGTTCQVSYMIYEQRTGGTFRYMEDDCLGSVAGPASSEGLQFAIIIPTNTTLTTHNKVRNALAEELEEKGVLKEDSLRVVANYALILVRSSEGGERDEMEKKFWTEIDGKRIQTPLIPQGEPDVEYFVCVHTKWYSPLKCPVCFPKKYTDEKPLIETDRVSVVPVQMLGITEPDLFERRGRTIGGENLERVRALKNSLIYKHVIRNGNHYLYYFCLEKYFIQEQSDVIEWLKKERNKRKGVSDRIVYDIIVSPLHYSNAGFLAEVNHYLFDDAALVLNFEVEKEFRENVKTKYSNIIGLYYNLQQIGRKALIRFHFVDDSIVSAKTYTRAKTLFQSLIPQINSDIEIEVFSDVVVLLNRMSLDSIASLMGGDPGRNVMEEHFHAYVNLNISSMRNHEDACTECKLVSNYTNLRDQSSTNQQYNFWNARIDRHVPREVQNKLQEEFLAKKDERTERAYRRMFCTHMVNERLGRLGYEKNDAKKVREVMIELLSEPQEEQVEWIISYIKVFSRPFISFSKSNRDAIFQIMLWMIEYITAGLMSGQKKVQKGRELGRVCVYLKEQHNQSDRIICNLLITLMKRLSDLGSNYVIRKKNLAMILKAVDQLKLSDEEKEDFRKRYIGVIKRICCQSSDESKSMYFEYLMLYGKEFEDLEPETVLEPGRHLFSSLKGERNFAEEAFLENTRVLNDGIRDLARDYKKNQADDSQKNENIVKLLQEYYYENFQRLFVFYGYGELGGKQLTVEGIELLKTLVEIYQYLGGKTDGRQEKERREDEKDATAYYQHLLELIGKLTGAKNSYFLYKAVIDGAEDKAGSAQYYRIHANVNVDILSESLDLGGMKADTYVLKADAMENGEMVNRIIIKYDIYDEKKTLPINTIFLQIDLSKELSESRALILLKMVMAFRGMILQHLRQDFSNNMFQKWSAKEYFNKQMMLQRATDHTDRDNQLKYYNEILEIGRCDGVEYKKQQERNRALFHMVINSYIARMNMQLLAEANPEREPSKAAFRKVYYSQLKLLLDSLQRVEDCRILDENGEEKFSQSLLDGRVRLRQTQLGESLSFRRISIMIAELVLSAINHSGKKDKADVYIYREDTYLVVKNQFSSDKHIDQICQNIKDSVERRKDGISLATIRGTVNACYGLSGDEGVRIEVKTEERKKFFYVKLPILDIWEEYRPEMASVDADREA